MDKYTLSLPLIVSVQGCYKPELAPVETALKALCVTEMDFFLLSKQEREREESVAVNLAEAAWKRKSRLEKQA